MTRKSSLVALHKRKMETVVVDSKNQIQEIELSKIKPDTDQLRSNFDENKIDELADSIRENELLNPIHVMEQDGKYIIITGERRYRACKKIKRKTIPCIVRTDLSKKEVRTLQLIENLQRENLTTVEIARGLQAIKESGIKKQQEIADKVGMSKGNISKYFTILNKYPSNVLDTIEEKYKEVTLTDLYDNIKNKKGNSVNKSINDFMQKLSGNVDELPGKVEKEKTSNSKEYDKSERNKFSDEELEIAWKQLSKHRRKSIQLITKYITNKKLRALINETEE